MSDEILKVNFIFLLFEVEERKFETFPFFYTEILILTFLKHIFYNKLLLRVEAGKDIYFSKFR